MRCVGAKPDELIHVFVVHIPHLQRTSDIVATRLCTCSLQSVCLSVCLERACHRRRIYNCWTMFDTYMGPKPSFVFSRYGMIPLQRTPYNALSMRKKPYSCPFPMGFCHPAGGGPSHGHRQHAQKIVKIARDMRLRRYARGQIDAQTHRQTDTRAHHSTSPPLSQAK